MINPVVKEKKGSWVMQEGCLSLPEAGVKVKRAKEVFIEALDGSNRKMSFWAEVLFGRVIQHEIDHLRGRLIIDYANVIQKLSKY